MIRIFISSVQREFAQERKLLCKYIREDALLCKFFDPFIFEELPATNISASVAYLNDVAQSDIYLGIFGAEYGNENENGVSPTELEFDEATKNGKHRIAFVKRCTERNQKESKFIERVEKQLIRRSFDSYEELRTAVYAALVRYLEEKEFLRLFPWDATINKIATLNDIDTKKVKTFVDLAVEKRNLPIRYTDDNLLNILTHLNLATVDGKLTNSAILLFAKEPQKFFITSEVKCMVCIKSYAEMFLNS